MGFLNWWQNNAPETDSQMDLFGNSQDLVQQERVDGAIVNKDFNRVIKDSGGSNSAYGRAVQAETQELFDCDVDQLYQETGGRKGDRSTLPKEAQKGYIVNETLSTHRLKDTDYQGSQRQKDNAIVEDVADTARRVRS
jgi:hypothetical protein